MSEPLVEPEIPSVLPGPSPEAKVSVFRLVPWKPLDILIGFAIPLAYLAISVLLQYGLTSETRQALPSAVRWLILLAGAVSYVGMGIFPLWLARRRWPDFRWRWPRLAEWRREIGVVLLSLPVIWGSLFLLTQVYVDQTQHPLHEWSEGAGPQPVLIVMLIAAFTVVPVIEELYFRGFLHNVLRRYFLLVPATLVQSLLFGLMHPLSLFYVLVTSVMALWLTALYEWRKTLLAPICLHGLHNLVGAITAFVIMMQVANAPFLGVNGEANPQGCRITKVGPGTAAEKAGLQVGDVIAEFGEYGVTDFQELRRAVRQHQVGDRVRIGFWRDGGYWEITVELEARPAS